MPIDEQILTDLRKGEAYTRVLNLENMQLNDKDMLDLLNATPKGWKFFHIVLTNNNITSGGAQIISELSIKRLDLDSNRIGNIGAKYLARNSSTTHLDLRNNKLSEEGEKFFKNNKTLEVLNLEGNETSNSESEQNPGVTINLK